ncbi:hypothetical protein VTL71DRAFT_3833 [Oculimacula yallundae]|uniref:Uncharacterized protein n=1 Tax=Oculimacula yallundae TaxID=86028 RepID=A0ABR4C433_9HELO
MIEISIVERTIAEKYAPSSRKNLEATMVRAPFELARTLGLQMKCCIIDTLRIIAATLYINPDPSPTKHHSQAIDTIKAPIPVTNMAAKLHTHIRKKPKPGLRSSKYPFPILEASPFVFGAIAVTFWEAFQLGPYINHRAVDYLWCLPSAMMNGLAVGYLIHHASGCRTEWYAITPLTRAVLDVTRTYASCYILALFALANGVKMIFIMAAYSRAYDATSADPKADGVFQTVCVFLILAYCIVVTGVGFLIAMPMKKDREQLRREVGVYNSWSDRFVDGALEELGGAGSSN